MIDIGTMDRKIDVYGYQDVKNSIGMTEKKPVKLYSTWARIEPLRGREYYEAQRIKDENSFKIIIRYRKNIDSNMLIKYQGYMLQIQNIADPYMAHDTLELHCIERVRGKNGR